MSLSDLWNSYLARLQSHPLQTKTPTAGFLFAIAFFISWRNGANGALPLTLAKKNAKILDKSKNPDDHTQLRLDVPGLLNTFAFYLSKGRRRSLALAIGIATILSGSN